MENEATSLSPVTKRRGRKPKLATVPPAPKHLQQQVDRAAKVIQKHQKVLGPIGIEALRVATLQVVAQQLSDIQALLNANGLATGTAQARPPLLHTPPTGPTCALCGRQGIYQSKSARVEKGEKRPWYCRDHAAPYAMEDREAAMVKMPAAAPAAGAPNLQAAMAALNGSDG